MLPIASRTCLRRTRMPLATPSPSQTADAFPPPAVPPSATASPAFWLQTLCSPCRSLRRRRQGPLPSTLPPNPTEPRRPGVGTAYHSRAHIHPGPSRHSTPATTFWRRHAASTPEWTKCSPDGLAPILQRCELLGHPHLYPPASRPWCGGHLLSCPAPCLTCTIDRG